MPHCGCIYKAFSEVALMNQIPISDSEGEFFNNKDEIELKTRTSCKVEGNFCVENPLIQIFRTGKQFEIPAQEVADSMIQTRFLVSLTMLMKQSNANRDIPVRKKKKKKKKERKMRAKTTKELHRLCAPFTS